MKRLVYLLISGSVLAAVSQAQGGDDISLSEFRQALRDSLAVVDSARGTTFAATIPSIPDSILAKWYKLAPNPRAFSEAATALKENKNSGAVAGSYSGPIDMAGRPAARRSGGVFSPLASSSTGIGSAPVPDLTPAVPGYPSGGSWSSMASTLQGVSALPSGDVKATRCNADSRSALSVTVSTFKGIKDAADAVCNIIPDPVIIVLGEGTAVPAKELCFGAALIVGGFTSAAEGYLSDCETHSALVDDAQNEAIYGNTVALYNLDFRLITEENLGNVTAPLAMFELPATAGGYLESARAIASEIITKLQSTGVNVTSALSAMQTGDNYYNAHQYKLAYKQYQKGYLTAVQ